MSGFIGVYNLLKKQGHEFVVITARGGFLEEMKDDAIRLLEEKNIKFDKYYWNVEDKLEICKKEGFPKCTEKQVNCIINFSEKKEFEEDFEEISKNDIENLNKFQASQLISNLIATNDNIYDYKCPLGVFEQQEDELQNVMTTVFKK